MDNAAHQAARTILSLLGAVAGGVVGYYTFQWLIRQNFYGLMIPGAFLGLGCGLLSEQASRLRGVLCAIAGLTLSLYAEWTFQTFKADGGFLYMVTHLHQKQGVTLLMLALGAFFAYWLGKDGGFRLLSGRTGPAQPVREESRRVPD